MIQPQIALPGSKIAVIAPCSSPTMTEVRTGIAKLQKLGYQAVDYVGKMYEEESDEKRLASLNSGLDDPDAGILLAARGGYGMLRILDKLDYEKIKRNRKIICGFSDMTALSLAVYKKTGLITLSGPMLRTHFGKKTSALTRKSFTDHIGGDYRKGSKVNLNKLSARIIRGGIAEGILLGGNLSVLSRMIGSKYLPDLKDSILFVEDVDEHPGRLENMLSQLRLSGILSKIRGFIGGQFSGCMTGKKQDQLNSIKTVLHDYLYDYRIPTICNLPFGHENKIITLPVGLRVSLDISHGSLVYLEDVVV